MKKAVLVLLTVALFTILATPVFADDVYTVNNKPELTFTTIDDLPDSEDLFAEYVNDVFDIEEDEDLSFETNGLVTERDEALNQIALDSQNRKAVNYLRTLVADVADGERESTAFQIPFSEIGLKAEYTADELGVQSLVENGSISDAAKNAMYDLITMDITVVMKYLSAEAPYELYWFDKTVGYSYYTNNRWMGLQVYTNSNDERVISFRDEDAYIPVWLTVASAYRGTFAANEWKADTKATGTAKNAAANAINVVNNHVTELDYDKLSSYKDYICEQVTYNEAAASNSWTEGYGDPWQLIYVFDNNNETNVVCEGYSKAFKYLCDKSVWHDNTFNCILAVGGLASNYDTSYGGHMWNVVTLGGNNYMVDVTNSDSGAAGGENGRLFMTGTPVGTGLSYANPYKFYMSESFYLAYYYYENTTDVYDTEIVLSDGDYDHSAEKHDYGCQNYSAGTVTYKCGICNKETTAEVDTGSLSAGQFNMQDVLDYLADEIDLKGQNLSVDLGIYVDDGTASTNSSGAHTVRYEVHPRAEVYSGDTPLGEKEITNDQIAEGASFTFRLDVPDSLVTQPVDKHYVKVTHTSANQTTECRTYPVKGTAGNYYVDVTTSSFSSFELEEVTVSAVGDCIVTVSLTLSDEIAINLYVRSLKDGTNAENYSVLYSFNGSTTRSSLGTADSEGRYKFEVARCAAKEMIDNVHFEVIYTDPSTSDTTVVKSINYSIRQYCTDTIDEGKDAYLTALCKSVLDYGAYAQQFFGYKTQTLANAGDKYTAGTAAINDVSGLTGYQAATTKGDGTTLITGSLSLLSKLELNFYFYGSTCTEDATVTTGDSDNSVVVTTTRDTENGRVKVTVGNIAARYLGDTYTVTLGNSSVTYSPMTYAQLYQNAEKEGMICKCLYHYYRNAVEYFNHKTN